MNETGSSVAVDSVLAPPTPCQASPLELDPGLRTVVDAFPGPVLVADNSRRYVYVNSAAEHFLGFPASEILGRRIDDFTATDLREQIAQAWTAFLSQGSQQGSFEMHCAGGHIKTVEFSAVANFRPGLHISFLKDRTEAERAEQARVESERMARLALSAGRMGHFMWDHDKQCLSCSDTVERLWSIERDQSADVSTQYALMLERIHSADRSYIEQRLGDTLRFGYECELEFRVTGQGDSLTWITLRAQTMFDRDGRRCGLLGICWDTTHTRESERALRLSEVRFRTLLEQSPIGTQLFDPSGACLLANPAYLEFWGLTPESRREYNIRQDPYLAERGLLPAIERAFAGHATELPAVPYRPETGPHEGQEVWLRSFLYPVHDDDGDLRELVLIQEDVTQSKRIEQDRTRKIEELIRSNSELERFAYGASHDLKEPLRNTLAFAELLRNQLADKLEPQHREYLGYIVSGAQRMSNLIDSLLEYSRASVQRDLLLVNADLMELLQHARENLRTTIQQTGAQISIEPLPTVKVAPLSIVQLFQNLVGNAIKYSGDRTPEIKIGSRVLPQAWEIYVQDSGLGIAREHHEDIFGVFRRLHGRDQPGSGLGLAICKAIVEKHGGRIWVESEPDKGATFRFTLPK